MLRHCRNEDLVELALAEGLLDRIHGVVSNRYRPFDGPVCRLLEKRKREREYLFSLGMMAAPLVVSDFAVVGRVRNEKVEGRGPL
jgi:hypothetical protein